MRRKRLEMTLAGCGTLLVALAAVWIHGGALPHKELTIERAGCRVPVTVLTPPSGPTPTGPPGARAAILLHGLSANRRVMTYLGADFAADGFRVYLPDLPGHGDSEDRFSFAHAEECAQITVDSLLRTEQLDPARTVVIGHSMGGAFAIRLADRIPVAATIAISPAPLVAPRRMPANLLVFSAQFDLWPLSREATALAQDAGGTRAAAADFREQRAFELDHMTLATHTSMLSDARVAQRAERWAELATGGEAEADSPAQRRDVRGGALVEGTLLGLVGLVMIVPLLVAGAAGIVSGAAKRAVPVKPVTPVHARYGLLLAEGTVCALAAVLLLALGTPLRFLHIYSGDYLVSALFIVGVGMLALNREALTGQSPFAPRAFLPSALACAALAFAIVLGFGAWFNWQVTDLWPNTARWVRFLALVPFLGTFCLAEEVYLGPVPSGSGRIRRLSLFLAIRLAIWLAFVLAYFELASGQVLLPILVLPLAGISVAQRLVADALRARGCPAAGAAVFDAILAAWFVAAVFPIT